MSELEKLDTEISDLIDYVSDDVGVLNDIFLDAIINDVKLSVSDKKRLLVFVLNELREIEQESQEQANIIKHNKNIIV